MIIGSCLGIFYQMLQKPQLRRPYWLKKNKPPKQNKTEPWLKGVVERETDMKQTEKSQNKKNENVYINGRKANLIVV